jgi:serine/threonine-protein phosphatase 2B catalytic subunit
MDGTRSNGTRNEIDALGVQGNQIRRYIHSFDDACVLLYRHGCPPADPRCRRRFDIANERLPEFSNLPASYPSVPVPSMRRAQRPWGSGDTTPTGEGDYAHDVSPVAGADVPGGWPVVPREEPSRHSRVGEGNEDPGLTERMVERIADGPRADVLRADAPRADAPLADAPRADAPRAEGRRGRRAAGRRGGRT